MSASRLPHGQRTARPGHLRGASPTFFWVVDSTPGRLPAFASPPSASPAGKPATTDSSPSVSVLDRPLAAQSPASTTTAAAAAATPAAPASTAALTALPDRTSGYLSLALVPLLWGTYNPCIRYLYAEADPLDPASLTAVRTLMSAGALLLPALLGYLYREGRAAWTRRQEQQQQQLEQEKAAQQLRQSGAEGTGVTPASTSAAAGCREIDVHHAPLGITMAAVSDGAADGVSAAAVDPSAEELEAAVEGPAAAKKEERRSLLSEPLSTTRLGPVLTRTFDSVILGGLELGLLNFLGTALQVEGLHSTSATRAGFLAEVTAVLTPLVSYLAGYEIPRQMWLAVAVGLVGSTMVAYDTSQARDSSTPSKPEASLGSTAAAGASPDPSPALAPTAVAATTASAPTALPALTQQSAPVSTDAGASAFPGALQVTSGDSGVLNTTITAAAPAAAVAAPQPIGGVMPAEASASALVSDAPAGDMVAGVTTPDGDAVVSAAASNEPAQLGTPSLAAGAASDGAAGAPGGLLSAPLQQGGVSVELEAGSSGAVTEMAEVLQVPLVADGSEATTAAVATPASGLPPSPDVSTDAVVAAVSALDAAGTAQAAAAVSAAAAETLTSSSDAAASVLTLAAASASSAVAEAVGLNAEAAVDAADGVAGAVAEAASAAAVAVAEAGTPLAITGGEAYLLLACLFFSICTVRMGIYAPRMDTVGLAAMKKVGLSSMSVMWMAATNLQHGAALGSVFAFPDLSTRTPISVAVLFYSGLGPGALATYLQVAGLSTVPATTAQVIYSITPLCTAFFAALILGGEATGPVAWAGGGLIIFAALMAANAQHNQHKELQRQHQQQQLQQQQQLAAPPASQDTA